MLEDYGPSKISLKMLHPGKSIIKAAEKKRAISTTVIKERRNREGKEI